MRLSELILLGDLLRRRDPIRYLEEENCGQGHCGCALGGALLASGYDDPRMLYKVWPWLADENPANRAKGFTWTHDLEISHQFFDVCRGAQTIEQLADYIRSIEPDEPVQKMDKTPTLQLQEVTQ